MTANPSEPPPWLNENFLQYALKDTFRRGSLLLTDYDICPATSKGENFLSQMFRVSATINSRLQNPEDMSLIIKSLPAGEMVKKFAREMKFFEKEIVMAKKTLPAMQQILDEVEKMPKLFAAAYYQQGPPRNLIIFEDLKRAGFTMANRVEGLDLHHSLLVVEYIATFHAASLEAIRRDPNIPNLYNEGVWSRNNAGRSMKMITDGLLALANTVEKWEWIAPDIATRLRKLSQLAPEKVYEATDLKKEDFNVLNHGDTWISNFMFKYENEIPVALKFVDFQLSFYSSPVFDLLFFIFSSPQPYVISNHLNLLLETYHSRLTDICRRINYPLIFTIGDLRAALFERLIFGLSISVTVFPIVRAPSCGGADLDDLMSDEGIGVDANLFEKEAFVAGMKSMLPIFIDNGLLD